jgi:hypothetical protein
MVLVGLLVIFSFASGSGFWKPFRRLNPVTPSTNSQSPPLCSK